MKTRFLINEEIFSGHNTLHECYEYYEKYFKKYGFVLDKENEDVYKEFDRPIILNEGDRIMMDGIGISIITWKCYDVDNDIIIYALGEE